MLLHRAEFLVRQLAGLIQDRIGNVDLSHVVQRRRTDDAADEFIRHLLLIKAAFAHFIRDDLHIGSRFLDMVAGVLVTALHHVGQHHDQTVLHLRDGLIFVLDIGDIIHAVLRGFCNGMVQILDLVACPDAQLADAFDIFLTCLVTVVGKRTGRIRHRVDRQHDALLNDPQTHCQRQYKHHDHKDQQPHRKIPPIIMQIIHRDIHAGIAAADAGTVIDRLIDGQKPAIAVIRDQCGDLMPCQQIVDIRLEAFFKRDKITGLRAGKFLRIQIENRIAPILADLVHINEFHLRVAAAKPVELLLDLVVIRMSSALCDVGIDIVTVDDRCHRIS